MSPLHEVLRMPRLRAPALAELTAPLILSAALLASGPASAAKAELMSAALTLDEPGERPGLFIEAHYEFDLPMPLIDAMHRGIALYFKYEFGLSRERWYWLNKDVAESTFNIRLAFNPLTRRYAVSYSGISLNFDTLDEALPYIKNIRRWRVAASDAAAGSNYQAEIRFSLDTGKLPKPMQVTNHDSGDWTVESSWEPVAIPEDVRRAAGE